VCPGLSQGVCSGSIAATQAAAATNFDDFEDDIPF
jgi:hypothetical protein